MERKNKNCLLKFAVKCLLLSWNFKCCTLTGHSQMWTELSVVERDGKKNQEASENRTTRNSKLRIVKIRKALTCSNPLPWKIWLKKASRQDLAVDELITPREGHPRASSTATGSFFPWSLEHHWCHCPQPPVLGSVPMTMLLGDHKRKTWGLIKEFLVFWSHTCICVWVHRDTMSLYLVRIREDTICTFLWPKQMNRPGGGLSSNYCLTQSSGAQPCHLRAVEQVGPQTNPDQLAPNIEILASESELQLFKGVLVSFSNIRMAPTSES